MLSFRSFAAALVALALVGSADAQTSRVRLMAANTSSGDFQAYEQPGIRIFQGLDPDIVMIQEFNYLNNTTTDLRNFVDTAFGTEFSYYREGGGEQIPNGIISRYPIIASGEWNDANVSNRDFAWAKIDIPGPVDLWAVSVHFLTTSSSNRNAQAQDLVAYINANVPDGDYLVIGGDLNTGSRSEACIGTLQSVITTSNTPVDQRGDGDTNAGRSKPYDWVLPDGDLNARHTAVVIGNSTYNTGLVFDSRVYTPLSEVSPVQSGDSGVSGMQHMAVVKDFLIPNSGATTTPSPTPSPTSIPGTVTATPTPGPTGVPGEAGTFINEIHYDNASEDANEGVEVAGPAGQSLAGWSLVPYNGATSGVVEEIALSGAIPTQQGCMGTVWVPIEGLQNGSPDGIALVDNQGSVVQFLSWEGTFTASGGPANGMTSVDIGVEETNSGSATDSMQLTGTGSRYTDFTWNAALPSTNGQVNQQQTFTGCAATSTPSPTQTPPPTPTQTPQITPTPTPPSLNESSWLVY